MNPSTIERARARSERGTPRRDLRLHRAATPVAPVEFTAPDSGDDAPEQHPGADRSAENMSTLRTPFTPSPAEARAVA